MPLKLPFFATRSDLQRLRLLAHEGRRRRSSRSRPGPHRLQVRAGPPHQTGEQEGDAAVWYQTDPSSGPHTPTCTIYVEPSPARSSTARGPAETLRGPDGTDGLVIIDGKLGFTDAGETEIGDRGQRELLEAQPGRADPAGGLAGARAGAPRASARCSRAFDERARSDPAPLESKAHACQRHVDEGRSGDLGPSCSRSHDVRVRLTTTTARDVPAPDDGGGVAQHGSVDGRREQRRALGPRPPRVRRERAPRHAVEELLRLGHEHDKAADPIATDGTVDTPSRARP